jgi:serine/threonine-protein kinase RsbW
MADAVTEWRRRVPAELERLGEVRALVREVGAATGASQDAIDDLVQAVDEAAANAVVHGYAGQPGWVEVTLEDAGADLVVTVEDAAPTYDPTHVPEPDMAVPALVRGPGGMGLHLIRLATDHVAYRPRDGGGNILTMTRTKARRSKEGG